MSLREEIYSHLWMITDKSRNNLTDKIIKDIEKRIDTKIQNITNLINDDRITTEGWYKAKGMKEAYENVKNMLSNQIN